ncbi:MAG: DUF3237 domain-containing protein [Pseudomonadales bacterium]
MHDELSGTFLCEAVIELDESAPLAIGASPWRNRRVSDIAGGRFAGPGLSGTVRRSGADWSEGGIAVDGGIATALDVRSVWETDDGALIYVSYGGRLVVPAASMAAFRDPATLESLDTSAYYFRTCPLFETSAEQYRWLNEIVTVGLGRRTPRGVVYRIFQVN